MAKFRENYIYEVKNNQLNSDNIKCIELGCKISCDKDLCINFLERIKLETERLSTDYKECNSLNEVDNLDKLIELLIGWKRLKYKTLDEDYYNSVIIPYNIIVEVDKLTTNIISKNYSMYIDFLCSDKINFTSAGEFLSREENMHEYLEKISKTKKITKEEFIEKLLPDLKSMADYIISVCEYLEDNKSKFKNI